MELIRGNKDTLWGCQEEIGRWWRVEEDRELERSEITREEVEAMEQVVASEFVVEADHQDTSENPDAEAAINTTLNGYCFLACV